MCTAVRPLGLGFELGLGSGLGEGCGILVQVLDLGELVQLVDLPTGDGKSRRGMHAPWSSVLTRTTPNPNPGPELTSANNCSTPIPASLLEPNSEPSLEMLPEASVSVHHRVYQCIEGLWAGGMRPLRGYGQGA